MSGPGQSPAEDEARRKILNRLRRAQGQLAAVITAVEAEAGCRTVITQLSACTAALDRAGFAIVTEALKECVTEGETSDPDALSLAELEKLFLTLA
ncbi:metal-sensitive transcriptional regulator [Mycetocola spongiae]|uniref:metal-sensitive transcriptional regulator n=1 Tax=Mycetocola spongiae TaxID=2859226 RepID=UPI001CF30745|nr:metal-sensitive transcriptional regulator [Mycetocola spongiae]UCR88343.1 metal-sensitive transcriptional regulator [Mycetocola spongiae]